MDPGVSRLADDGAWEDVRALVRAVRGDVPDGCAEALLAAADPGTAAILLWLDGLRLSDGALARLLAEDPPGTREVLRAEAERRERVREGPGAYAAHLARSGRVEVLVDAILESEPLLSISLGPGCDGIARVATEAGNEAGLAALVRWAGAPIVFGQGDDALPGHLRSLRERRRALLGEGPRLFARACVRSDAVDLAAGRTHEPTALPLRHAQRGGDAGARLCRMESLPLGATLALLAFLPAPSLGRVACCSRWWREAAQAPVVWARLVWPPAVLGATPCSGVFAAAGLSCRRARRGAGWRPPKAGDVLVGELPPLPHRATSCAEAAATPWSSVAGAQAAGLSALCVHATAAAVRWFHVLPRVGGVRSGGSGPPAVCVSRRRQWGSPPPSWMRSLCVEPGRGDDAFAVPPGHAVLRCPSGERGDARGHPLWTTGRGHTLVVALVGHLLRACGDEGGGHTPSHLVVVTPYWLPATASRRLRWLLDSATPPKRRVAVVSAPHAALCRVGGHTGVVVWLGEGETWACPVWRGQLLPRFAWPHAGAAAALATAEDWPGADAAAAAAAAVEEEAEAPAARGDADSTVIAALRRMLGRLSGALGQHAADDMAQSVILVGPGVEARGERLTCACTPQPAPPGAQWLVTRSAAALPWPAALAAESLRVCRLHPLAGRDGPWALARGAAALAMAWAADSCREGEAAPPGVEEEAEARSAFAWHGRVLDAVGQEGPA